MRLSRKSDYALRSLLHLSVRDGEVVSVRELAAQNNIPRKFLESIMRDLRAFGLVRSVAGKKGGYVLLPRGRTVWVGTVLRHFDGRLEADVEEIPGEDQSPSMPTARMRKALRDIGAAVDALMDEMTLEDVLHDRPIRYSISNKSEFELGDGI